MTDENELSVEFFYGDCPSLDSLSSYRNRLTCLIVIGQDSIVSMRGIEVFPQLKELWFVECGLVKVSYLHNAKKLQKLYLYSNRLSKIDNLHFCSNLQTLWLDNNCLTSLDGLGGLVNLRCLNVSFNAVESLGTLVKCECAEALQWLNISGNRVCLLEQLQTLPLLGGLRELVTRDFLHGNCQTSPRHVCHARLLLVHALPNLQRLDDCCVSEQERCRVRMLLASRAVFYRARQRHVDTDWEEQGRQLRRQWVDFLADMYARALRLELLLQRVGEQLVLRAADEGSESLLQADCRAVRRRVQCLESVLARQEVGLRRRLHVLQQRRRLLRMLLQLELEYAGGITAAELAMPGDSRAPSMPDAAALLVQLGLPLRLDSAVSVLSVVAVENRLLSDGGREGGADACVFRFVTCADSTWSDDWVLSGCCGRFDLFAGRVTIGDTLVYEDDSKSSSLDRLVETSFCHCRVAFVVELPGGGGCADEGGDSGGIDCGEVLCDAVPRWLLLYSGSAQLDWRAYECSSNVHLDDELVAAVSERLPSSPPVPVLVDPAQAVCVGAVLLAAARGTLALDLRGKLHALNELNLSCNALRDISALGGVATIQVLNVRFNLLADLAVVQSLHNLQRLDGAWNKLTDLHRVLGLLRTSCRRLHCLDLSHNQWPQLRSEQLVLVRQLLLHVVEYAGESVVSGDRQDRAEVRQLRLDWEWSGPWWADCESLQPPPEHTLTCVDVSGQLLSSLRCLSHVRSLQRVAANGSGLQSLDGVQQLRQLQFLSVDDNHLTQIRQLDVVCARLSVISVRNNCVHSLKHFVGGELPALRVLDVSGNLLRSLEGLQGVAPALTELYAAHNQLHIVADVCALAATQHIQLVDLSHNGVTRDSSCRPYLVFRCRRLLMLNGEAVSGGERERAVSQMAGLLSVNSLAEMFGHGALAVLTRLDLPDLALTDVNLTAAQLPCLTSLNLAGNKVSSLSGLSALPLLHSLNMSANQVRRMGARCVRPSGGTPSLFPSLRVLVLSDNQLEQLGPLQLGQLPRLQQLYLCDNQLRRLEPVLECRQLCVLAADRNLLASVPSLVALHQLRVLLLEGNRLRRLPCTWPARLGVLHVAGNLLPPGAVAVLAGAAALRHLTVYRNSSAACQGALVSLQQLSWLDGCTVAQLRATNTDWCEECCLCSSDQE